MQTHGLPHSRPGTGADSRNLALERCSRVGLYEKGARVNSTASTHGDGVFARCKPARRMRNGGVKGV